MAKRRQALAKRRDTSTITLDAVDKKGRQRQATLKATMIGGSDELAESNADEPDPFDRKSLGKHGLLYPPYDLHRLISLKEQSTELGQCVQAMVTNTVGFGWILREVPMAEDVRERNATAIADEKAMLSAMLRSVHPTMSFSRLRKNVKDDQHSCGNGYLELLESPINGRLVGVNHLRGHLVRLTEKDNKSVKVLVPRPRPDLDQKIEAVPMLHRFRKFVMIRRRRPVFFKEAGDPRMLDKWSGEYGDGIKPSRCASALIHFSNYSAVTPYGLPNWIGNLFSIMGSRQAEQVNYATLQNNAIPSCFVIVENGALTGPSIDRLREWTEEQIVKSVNRSKFLLLEGDVLEEGGPNPSNFRIRVEPLKSLQEKDELYQVYDGNNRDKIRQAFRLPPIFVGRSDDYTRATADTSRDIADEQVFAPEREDDDFLINRFMLLRWGARFHVFRSNHPNITDDIELIRLMAIAERSGAMTPRRADRIVRDVFGDDIGPMPQGIDLDSPYSLTFAGAQQGGPAPAGPAEASAGQMVDSLLQLRKQIEAEIYGRTYHDFDDKEQP